MAHGWATESVTHWMERHKTPLWSWAVRQARLRHWNRSLQGDRLQPARRVLINGGGRIFTARTKPAARTSGAFRRPPWVAHILKEAPPPPPNEARHETCMTEVIQGLATSSVEGPLPPLELRLENDLAEHLHALRGGREGVNLPHGTRAWWVSGVRH